MTGRTHFILIALLVGGVALVTTTGDFLHWRMHWPVNVTWVTMPFLLVWPLVIGHGALWKPDAPRERLQRACIFLLIAAYLGITSSMLLLQEALARTR